MKHGKPVVHAHAVIGKKDGTAHGGHLLESHIRPKCEDIFTERPVRKTRQRFCCCTDFRLHRGCSSRSSRGFPIATTLSRLITQASDIAIGRTRKHSLTPLITSLK